MTLNVYTIVWNEEFMLPKFLDYYSKYANQIYVIDDHSTDLTARVAKAHPKVTYVPYKYEGLVEQEFSDTYVEMAKAHPSTWAVTVDCDEFIHGLETLKDEEPGILKTTGYMMIGKTGQLEDCKQIRMKQFDKPVVFTPDSEIHFNDGRHTIKEPTRDSKLELWHYKYPSREYYLKRNRAAYPRIMEESMVAYRLQRGLDWYDSHI